ncbi:hypothetical protein HYD75_04110 [Mycoplasmopsis bovis]|nr:hypothetical protein [Mycoplasmopsis bovis]QQH49041.1 hypothetical protein HYD75_04110 [Mycoplasmopsis bovis]
MNRRERKTQERNKTKPTKKKNRQENQQKQDKKKTYKTFKQEKPQRKNRKVKQKKRNKKHKKKTRLLGDKTNSKQIWEEKREQTTTLQTHKQPKAAIKEITDQKQIKHTRIRHNSKTN